MEITIRHVLEVSPQLAELLGRLLAGVARREGEPQGAVAVAEQDGRQVRGGMPRNEPSIGLDPAVAAEPPQEPVPIVPEPAADAAPAPPPAPKRGEWRTAARREVLKQMYPAGDDIDQIRAALAALDGPPLPDPRYAVGHWAKYLKLKRPDDGAEPWRTPERLAVLKETWEQGVDVEVIVARMLALPGGPVLAPRVSVWASGLGLSRPEWHAAKLARERTARLRDTRWVKAADASPADLVEQDTRAGVAGVAASEGSPVQGGGAVSAPMEAADGAVPDMALPQPKAATPAQAGGEAAPSGSRPPAPPEPPVAPRVTAPPPKLPAPSNGRVHASFREIKAWAGHYGILYTGGNIDAVNNRRRLMKLAPLVEDEDRTATDTRPARPAPPPLPAPVDGLVRASFREIRAWAAFHGIAYDGGNADVVNRRRAGMGLPPVAQCEARTRADAARAA